MYFNEKGNTNIDSEFDDKKKFNFDFKNLNLKPILLIGGAIVLLLIVVFAVISITKNSSSYRIELIGGNKIVLNIGDDYIEPGYKAYDKQNRDVSNQVKTSGNVEIHTPGEYKIIYSIQNIKVERTVTVIEKSQDTYIQLLGNKTMYIRVGETFVDPGYKAFDSIDKNLQVQVTGSVNTQKKGTYRITYTVTNSRNFTTSTTRVVVVQ